MRMEANAMTKGRATLSVRSIYLAHLSALPKSFIPILLAVTARVLGREILRLAFAGHTKSEKVLVLG